MSYKGRAAALLGVPPAAAAPAEEADLLEIGIRVRFRHPLVRSAAYRAAAPASRREIHRALTALAGIILNNGALDPSVPAWIVPVAADLKAHAGRALIHIGPDQPAEYHALVHALNEALGGH